MTSLEEVFREMAEGVRAKEPRYKILNCEHVMDTVKDIEYHLEKGQTYTITKGEDVVLDGNEITNEEAGILMRLAEDLPKLYADWRREHFHTLVSNGEEPAVGVPPRGGRRYTP